MDRSAIAAPRAKVVLELPTAVPADDAPPDALRILFSPRRRRPLRGLSAPQREAWEGKAGLRRPPMCPKTRLRAPEGS